MNTSRFVTALAIALVASPAAFAQSEIELQHFGANQSSSVSRADVRADVLKAQAAGTLVTPGEVLASTVPSRNASTVQATRAAAQEQARVQARTDTYKDRARIGAGF